MYPTVLMILVETQRLMTADICESLGNANKPAGPQASEARPATSGHLYFADGPIRATMHNESESQHLRTWQSQHGQEHNLEKDILEVKESRASCITG